MVLCLESYREGGEGGTESSCPGGGGGEVGENLVSQEGRRREAIYHILFHIEQVIFHLSNQQK